MATVFLSHRLSPKHPAWAQMAAAGHRLIAVSMLTFETLEFELPHRTDWVFAYSCNGVEGFLAEQQASAWLAENAGVRLAAIGLKTAEAWAAAGLEVDFVGTGEPASTARAFGSMAASQTVTFIQAQESRGSVAALLQDELVVQTLITYRAVPASVNLPTVDIALLTSPRSAELFLEPVDRDFVPRLYCIGPTTAEAVKSLGFSVAGVAAVARVEELVGLAVRQLGL